MTAGFGLSTLGVLDQFRRMALYRIRRGHNVEGQRLAEPITALVAAISSQHIGLLGVTWTGCVTQEFLPSLFWQYPQPQ